MVMPRRAKVLALGWEVALAHVFMDGGNWGEAETTFKADGFDGGVAGALAWAMALTCGEGVAQ